MQKKIAGIGPTGARGTLEPYAGDERTILYRSATGGYDCGCQCASEGQACEQLELFSDESCTEPVATLNLNGPGTCAAADLEELPIGSVQVPTGPCVDAGSRNTPEPP